MKAFTHTQRKRVYEMGGQKDTEKKGSQGKKSERGKYMLTAGSDMT